MSKYPKFERTTAGTLKKGDRVLIREGVQDGFILRGQVGPWDERRRLLPGIYTVRVTNAYWVTGRRSSRHYIVTFEETDPVEGGFIELDTSAVQRFNRVLE